MKKNKNTGKKGTKINLILRKRIKMLLQGENISNIH